MEFIVFKKSIFIFRRDLRLEDNLGLTQAVAQSEKVIPIFIFDERQVHEKKNVYFSQRSLQFMFESLDDLQENIKKHDGKLYFFYGKAEDVIEKIIKTESVDAVFFNADYTPFSRKRDDAIEKVCKKNKIDCFSFHDALLIHPEDILNGQKKPYQVFTAFYKRCLQENVPDEVVIKKYYFFTGSVEHAVSFSAMKKELLGQIVESVLRGGREHALKILKNIDQYKKYDTTRDIPELDSTTHLSAYLKFGCVSARQVVRAIQKELGATGAGLVRQVYWRDFYTYIAWHFPHVFTGSFVPKYDKLQWRTDKKLFDAWVQGQTGFPIVDAGMRQLAQTGYMHNRVRLIVASFLIKDLHISWQEGEKYFASQLVDYDPSVNNGNWQWVASTGCDAAPYFRIFNPWMQQEKFDPQCVYIKTWVPELQKISPKDIHGYFTKPIDIVGYPKPIVDHSNEVKTTKLLYGKVV
ncbi:deoxyribodipyrimidine photo-lyase [bacterium]|nr:deoxyribodipyrimidine photo-lyase [bacterium]